MPDAGWPDLSWSGIALWGSGAICVGVAICLLWNVDEVKLGEKSSRLVGLICVALAYYYVGYTYNLGGGSWLLQVAVALIFLGLLVGFSRDIGANRRAEFTAIVESSGPLVAAVVLGVVGRVLLSL